MAEQKKLSYTDSAGNNRELLGIARTHNHHLEQPKPIQGPSSAGPGDNPFNTVANIVNGVREAVVGGLNALSHVVAVEKVNGHIEMRSEEDFIKSMDGDPKAKGYMNDVLGKIHLELVKEMAAGSKPLQIIDKPEDFKIPDSASVSPVTGPVGSAPLPANKM